MKVVVLKVLTVFGMAMALMALGNVSAEDQPTMVSSETITSSMMQQIPVPLPIPVPGGGPIGPTNWGGGGSGANPRPEPCMGC